MELSRQRTFFPSAHPSLGLSPNSFIHLHVMANTTTSPTTNCRSSCKISTIQIGSNWMAKARTTNSHQSHIQFATATQLRFRFFCSEHRWSGGKKRPDTTITTTTTAALYNHKCMAFFPTAFLRSRSISSFVHPHLSNELKPCCTTNIKTQPNNCYVNKWKKFIPEFAFDDAQYTQQLQDNAMTNKNKKKSFFRKQQKKKKNYNNLNNISNGNLI